MSTNVITIISKCNFANQRIVVKIASTKYIHAMCLHSLTLQNTF